MAAPSDRVGSLTSGAQRQRHDVIAEAQDAADLAMIVATVRPELVVAFAVPRYLDAAVLAACDDAGVRLVALVADDAGRRLVSALGIYETADVGADWAAIEAAQSSTPPGARERSGTVIAVWGPVGSPGRTTIAIGIAAELAARGHSVALADVDTHGAAIAPALGLLDEAPGFAAACRLAGADSLTIEELDRIASHYESPAGGFRVLTGIGRASRWPELSGDRVTATIARCREWVDYTVLDTSASLENDEEVVSDLFAPRRNAAALAALQNADQVIAVGGGDPVGLSRFLRAHVDLLEVTAASAITVVMNRVRSSAVGMNPNGQVTQTLARFGGITDAILVPHDQNGVDGAVLSGRTLVDSAPRSPARNAIRDLVTARILPPETVPLSRRERRMLAASRSPEPSQRGRRSA